MRAATMLHRPRRPRGFTLIELLVTMAIGVVLMMVAVPNFVAYRRNAELSDAVGNLTLAAGAARSAALKSGRNAFVQVNDTGAGWNSGWFVFVDANWNNQYDEGTDEIVLRHDALTLEISATSSTGSNFAAGYVMYNGAGFPRLKTGGSGGGTLTMRISGRGTSVILDASGRLRSCKVGTSGCTAV